MSQVFLERRISFYCHHGSHENRKVKRRCKNIKGKCECDCHSKKITKADWVLWLIRSQKVNMNMICAFCKIDVTTARKIIIQLRIQGHDISLGSNQGFYEYRGRKI